MSMRPERYIISMPLFYALWIILKCPCDAIPFCHLSNFYYAMATTVLLVVIELNRPR